VTAVVDYGVGNLRSVLYALDRVGFSGCTASTGADLAGAERIVLPGVGNFGYLMPQLESRGLREALLREVARGVPLLGICLGMQALYEGSDEAPDVPGLGLIPGRVRRFPPGLPVPHMGWNQVTGEEGEDWYYFANGYFAAVGPETMASAVYGFPFAAEVRRGNVCGFQFHPERSDEAGLERLARWCRDAR
jgi:imidazole glycerol-phosphate synthase